MSYYKNKFPSNNDIVIITVSSCPEKGQSIQCSLTEYNNIPGIILRTEITKKRELEPKKIFKIDTHYPVIVINVDSSDSNNIKIDLSYVKLKDQERINHLEHFRYRNYIYSLAIEMKELCGMDHSTILKYTMWQFMENKKIIADIKEFYNEILEVPENFVHYFPIDYVEHCKKFVQNLRSRISSTNEFSTKNFTLTIFNSINNMSNIDTLKWCLTHNLNSEHVKCDIHFISPSKYLLSATSDIKSESSKYIEKAENIINDNLKNIVCKFEIDQVCKTVDKQYTVRKYFA